MKFIKLWFIAFFIGALVLCAACLFSGCNPTEQETAAYNRMEAHTDNGVTTIDYHNTSNYHLCLVTNSGHVFAVLVGYQACAIMEVR